ncbi:hypothetical protein GGR50DRAFT_353021 [Xylaria sp. CBS 124048]|nr:hypothetical protein GGR50DRAFT_353021 [Xylaria sp. CBS 124048]
MKMTKRATVTGLIRATGRRIAMIIGLMEHLGAEYGMLQRSSAGRERPSETPAKPGASNPRRTSRGPCRPPKRGFIAGPPIEIQPLTRSAVPNPLFLPFYAPVSTYFFVVYVLFSLFLPKGLVLVVIPTPPCTLDLHIQHEEGSGQKQSSLVMRGVRTGRPLQSRHSGERTLPMCLWDDGIRLACAGSKDMIEHVHRSAPI